MATPRAIKLLHLAATCRALRHIFKECHPECKTLFHCLTGAVKGDHFSESGADFFFWRWALTKTLSISNSVAGCGGRRWDQKPAILMNRTNEPRGPRRGGEIGASFLNWSHWDPQGSPCRTHCNTVKITPSGSDKGDERLRTGGERGSVG